MSRKDEFCYSKSVVDSAGRRRTIVAPPGTHLEIINRRGLPDKIYAVPNDKTITRYGLAEPYLGDYPCLFRRFSR